MGRNRRNKPWKADSHKYPGLIYENIYNPSQFAEVCEAFKGNEQCIRTESINGHFITVVSNGDVYSRSVLIANAESDDLKHINFQGESLCMVGAAYEKLQKLTAYFNTKFGYGERDEKFLVFLRGNFITQGTRRSRHDVYNYRNKGLVPGDFVTSGIGFVPQQHDHFDLCNKLRSFFFLVLVSDSPCPIGNEQYLSVPMDTVLDEILSDFEFQIVHVHVDKVDEFRKVFDPKAKVLLSDRKIDGFHLTCKHGSMFHWKYPEEEIKAQTMLVESLRHFLSKTEGVGQACSSLEQVCYSAKDFVSLRSVKKQIPDLFQQALDKWKEFHLGLELGRQMDTVETKLKFYQKCLVAEIVNLIRCDRWDTDLMMDPHLYAELKAFVGAKLKDMASRAVFQQGKDTVA